MSTVRPLVIGSLGITEIETGDVFPQSLVQNLTADLSSKLDTSTYTAVDVFDKVKTMDGSGSGLDADLLDGANGSFYLSWTNFTDKPTTLSGFGITDAQPLNSNLTAFAELSGIADRFPYFTASATLALGTVTSFARSLLDDADETQARATLGLTLGTDVQAFSANLDGLSGLNSTAGLVEQTGAATFTKRSIGVSNSSSVPTRADGDARWLSLSGGTMTGDIVLVGDGTLPNHPVTRAQLDAVVANTDPKPSVLTATTANITLSGLQTIEDHVGSDGDRVLVRAQTNAWQNGIWIMRSGAWERAPDMDTWSKFQGAETYVENGNLAGRKYLCLAPKTGTLGTTAVSWTTSFGGSLYTATNGVVLNSNSFELTGQALALHNLTGTGFIVRTASNTFAARSLAQPDAGLTITNPDAVSGNPTFALANDLAALEGLTGAGFARRTGTDAWSIVNLAQSDIAGLVSDLAAKANANNAALTGNPTAPTQTIGDNSTRIATTAFVNQTVAAVSSSLSIQASEALSEGNEVNFHNVSGNLRVRKASAATAGMEADGYVLANVSSGANATVFRSGVNDKKSGLTPGEILFLSSSASGAVQNTPPGASGQYVQIIGKAISATSYEFRRGDPIKRA